MAINIYNISNNPDGFNGKWYSKESLVNEIPDMVKVIDGNFGTELGVKTREEFISLLNESSYLYGFVNADFGEASYLATVFGFDKNYQYIYSTILH